MKKKVLLLVLASFMVAGIVSAASLWGTYKGNAIIKVNVDGQQYKTSGVPPIAYGGQVMLPLGVLKELGISYSYDSKKMTTTINSVKEPQSSLGEIEKLKAYVRIADYYDTLDEMGQSISNLANHFEVIYHHYMLGTDPNVSIDDAFADFNKQVNRFNDRLIIEQWAAEEAGKINANVSDISEIINNYSTALEYLKKSLYALENISRNGYSKDQYDVYFNNAGSGMDIADEYSLKAFTKYGEFISSAKK